MIDQYLDRLASEVYGHNRTMTRNLLERLLLPLLEAGDAACNSLEMLTELGEEWVENWRALLRGKP